MSVQLFSEEWARRWCAALNDSTTFREAAGSWVGMVALVVREVGAEPAAAAIVDAGGGECRSARAAGVEDLAAASYVFEAPVATWDEVFSGRLQPAMALMTGRLRLTRGSLAALMPHARAAAAMISAAAAIPRG
jgi:putative sterol carrier protein